MRKFIAVTASALALGAAMVIAPVSSASAAAYQCEYETSGSTNYMYSGYYGGLTVQPSSTGLSQAGIEAQCLLHRRAYNPGTIDGVFGSRSQAAALAFQKRMNAKFHVGLSEDGKVGPKTWPYLRNANYDTN